MDLEKQADSIQYKTNFRSLLRSLKDSYVVMREEGMDEEEITAYFIGIEKDDKYFEIAKKRIEETLHDATEN